MNKLTFFVPYLKGFAPTEKMGTQNKTNPQYLELKKQQIRQIVFVSTSVKKFKHTRGYII